jgi:hypothetical protein
MKQLKPILLTIEALFQRHYNSPQYFLLAHAKVLETTSIAGNIPVLISSFSKNSFCVIVSS